MYTGGKVVPGTRKRGVGMFKVILVEDEIVVREGIRENIDWEKYGFQYAGDAPDGELALPLIRQIKPDLLITDIKMPFMDGLALIELVRKELPKTKIVIISGYDDFSYAQQAIRMGVEQYLLKPIVKSKMVEVLTELHIKMTEELKQQEYFEEFRREVREYEMFTRRRFFEKIVTGGLSVQEICETAKELGLDVNAPCYNIVLFSLSSAGYDGNAPVGYTDSFAEVEDEIRKFISGRPELVLFGWNVTTYAILVKGGKDDIRQITDGCIRGIAGCCSRAGGNVIWHIACGTPVSRLGTIPGCFQEASRRLSYRYLCPDEHILTEESIRDIRSRYVPGRSSNKNEIDQERVLGFLGNGSTEDIGSFIDQLMQSAESEGIMPSVFCRYITMTVYLAAVKYMDAVGCRSYSIWSQELRPDDDVSMPEEARQYVRRVMEHVIELRDDVSKKQQRDLLNQAMEYIDRHYHEESMSLERVAKEINISPNYFSALFSQEVGLTFIEYLTNKRIDRAKYLLRYTDKRSGEIAFAVGYKDPHYFSFVFKKVMGCTPSEYRRGEKQ
jgi:two-component system response regulator YesN